MKLVVVISSLVCGLLLVGALVLLESVMQGFSAGWNLPFSAWWGLLIALPGLLMAKQFPREFGPLSDEK